MPLGMEVNLGPGDLVLDWTTLPCPKEGGTPKFSAHICGQTAGWIKMALGTEIGLDPSDIVFDGDPAPPPQKGGIAPNFRPKSIVAKRLDGSRWHLAWKQASTQATLC